MSLSPIFELRPKVWNGTAWLDIDHESLLRKATKISLRGKDLSHLPDGVNLLVHLRYLQLGGNQFSSIPEAICKCLSLTYLSLHENRINSIHASISNLTTLQALVLHRNSINKIPPALSCLTGLTFLGLSENQLSHIPQEIYSLSKLQALTLGQNQIGFISDSLSQLASLTLLGLSDNKITSLPSTIGKLTNMKELSFNSNKLTLIPDEIRLLTALTHLSMHENEISLVPNDIGHLVNLRELTLNTNKITTVPESITRLSKLTLLSLQENNIKFVTEKLGRILPLKYLGLDRNELEVVPSTFTRLTNLTFLTMHDNKLSASPDVSRFTCLRVLTLHANMISDLSNRFDSLFQLQRLVVSFNKLKSVPDSITLLTSLSYLSLHDNQIGALPHGIGTLSLLESLSAFSNAIHMVPDSITKLTNLTYLGLHENMISSVPADIGVLTKLHTLGLDKNRISTVPESVTYLVNLTWLGIHNNQITSISENIAALNKLKQLELYGNQLEKLPRSVGSLSLLTLLNISDNKITSIPDDVCDLTNLKVFWLSGNQISSLPEEIGRLQKLTELVLYKNPLSILPESMTMLKFLGDLQAIHDTDRQSSIYVPLGITNLSCWAKPSPLSMLPLYSNCKYSNLTSLDGLLHLLRVCHRFDASFNQLCALPISEPNYSQLRQLILSNNKFSEVPANVLGLCRLELLDMSANEISSLPIDFDCMTALKSLNLRRNKLPQFPGILLPMTWIEELEIVENEFSELPGEFTQLSNLKKFALSERNHDALLKIAPKGITTLPFWKETSTLNGFHLHDYGENPQLRNDIKRARISQSKCASPDECKSQLVKTVIQQITNGDATIDSWLLQEKLQGVPFPIIPPPKTEHHPHAEEACKNRVLCLICLDFCIDPCLLTCGHVFCRHCVPANDFTVDTPFPFCCPVCRELAHAIVPKDPQLLDEFDGINRIASQLANYAEVVQRFASVSTLDSQHDMEDGANSQIPANEDYHDRTATDYAPLTSEAAGHSIHQRETGKNPLQSKGPLFCHRHNSEICYYCKNCPQNPLKCATCLVIDHSQPTQKEHSNVYIRNDANVLSELIQKNQENVDKKRKDVDANIEFLKHEMNEVQKSYENSHDKACQYIDNIKELVSCLETSLFSQLEQLYTEVRAELQSKLDEVKREKEWLDLAAKMLPHSQFGQNGNLSLADLAGILAHCGTVTCRPAEEISMVPKRIIGKLPEAPLDQLRQLSQKLAFSLSPESPTGFFSEPLKSREVLWDVDIDQESNTAYATDENSTNVLAFRPNALGPDRFDTSFLFTNTPHSLRGLSLSPNGHIAIADAFARCVVVLDKKDGSIGRVLRHFDDNGPHEFASPCAVAFDGHGRLYVADANLKCVLRFDSFGNHCHRLTIDEVIDRKRRVPIAICIDESNRLFVLCSGSASVIVYDSDGKYRSEIPIQRVNTSRAVTMKHVSRGVFSVSDLIAQSMRFYDYQGKLLSEWSLKPNP
eukprot:TRINITY_DN3897_c0_g1_i1.p1 TRINITY_DN3897_c0_g1~~TRINITY_DN3897_c0_g1_i1.p1  ORF type:complete len:1483 (+),score=312.13 TRINITY_DN3897_c0_g1_i1:58-4506(+)